MNNRTRTQMRRKEVKRQKIYLAIICMLIVFSIAISCGSVFTSAKEDATHAPKEYKYYKSIVINDGDTLWNIANEYKPAFCDTQDYINEIKSLNGIVNDYIHEGQHLLVSYYDTELK